MTTPRIDGNPASLPLQRAIFGTGFQTSQRIVHLNDLLAQNGIQDLAALGKLVIGRGRNLVPTPGILTPPPPRSRIDIYVGRPSRLSGVALISNPPVTGLPSDIPVQLSYLDAYKLRSKPFATPAFEFRGTASASTPILPGKAYWVADEIEISHDTTIVFTFLCNHLSIIANSIKIGDNVVFTWQPLGGTQAKVQEDQPEQPPQTGLPSTQDVVIHGTDKVHGRDGIRGRNGADAPSVEIWALDFQGRPYVVLTGQNGQDGQDGQDGSKGQNGANGISGRAVLSSNRAPFCDRFAGSGGDGASGGNGGNGGDGGNGGKGGRFTIYAPQPVLTGLAGLGFHTNLLGGNGGKGGRGGKGGEGGEGGRVGRTDIVNFPLTSTPMITCGPKPGTKNGSPGSRGADGRVGRGGREGTHFGYNALRLISLDPDEFARQLSSAAIRRIDKALVTVGEQITIEGVNFKPGDKVIFNEVEANPIGVVTTTRLSAELPNLEGGNTRVVIRQADNTESNIATIVVRPKVTSVSQAGVTERRLMPGRETIIRGSGFSRDAVVLANVVSQANVRYVSSNELRCPLVRPFGPNELPDAAGEPVAIKVRIPATKAGNADSDGFNVVLDTIRMLVLGDSIQWGQGLRENQKFYTLVEDEIRRRAGGVGVYKSVYAHSGAIIGNAPGHSISRRIGGTHGGEVNTPRPTVREQVVLALKGKQSDDTVDLVLLDGGANDVEITRILQPLDPDLDRYIRMACYDRMKQLLEETSRSFPNAKIIVTGYFQMASKETDYSNFAWVLAGLGLLGGGILGPAGALIGGLAGGILTVAAMNSIVERCARFRDESHRYIKQAIKEVNSNAGDRIFFADPRFADTNAIFARNALIFGINPDLSPQDPIAPGRKIACDKNPGRTDFACPIASVGHPNPAGARRYAEAVITQLRSAMPELF